MKGAFLGRRDQGSPGNLSREELWSLDTMEFMVERKQPGGFGCFIRLWKNKAHKISIEQPL